MARPQHLSAVLALALLIRCVHAGEVASGPDAFLSELPQSDMYWYSLWAEEISEGDWLGRDLTLLDTEWQRNTASPEEWARWFGPPAYNPAPLYLYVLASVRAVAGPDPRIVIWLQALLGVGICALLYGIGSAAFGRRAGLGAAVVGALYGPLVFYEGFLLRTTWILALNLLFLLLLLRARHRDRPAGFVAAGVAGSLALLTQPTLLAFAPLAGVWLVVSAPSRRRGRLALACLVLGFALPFSALVARNLAVGASPLVIESRGPFALVFGNVPTDRSPGVGFSIPPDGARILRENDYRIFPALVAALASHDSPLALLRFEVGKILAVASDFEVYNNVNFQDARQRSVVLRWLPGFAGVMSLGALGLVLALGRSAGPKRHEQGLLLLFLLYGGVASVVSMVLSRYRMTLAVGLVPFAGFALVWGLEALRARRWRAVGLASASVGALALFSLSNLGVTLPAQRPADAIGRAQILDSRGGPEAAAVEIEQVLEGFAEDPRTQAYLLRSAAHFRVRAGQRGRARLHLREAARLEEASGH